MVYELHCLNSDILDIVSTFKHFMRRGTNTVLDHCWWQLNLFWTFEGFKLNIEFGAQNITSRKVWNNSTQELGKTILLLLSRQNRQDFSNIARSDHGGNVSHFFVVIMQCIFSRNYSTKIYLRNGVNTIMMVIYNFGSGTWGSILISLEASNSGRLYW